MRPVLSFEPQVQSRHQEPPSRLQEQARELEGVFLNSLLKEMFSSIETDGAFGGGFAEETWRGLQAEQLADSLAKAGGVGLATSLMADLIALQEAAQMLSSDPNAGVKK